MATINDVARAAGVSISTVSYALSGKRSIAASTRQRVDAAVRELGYRPNAGARMLAGTRSHILALSAPMRGELHLPTHMRFVTAVLESARAADYDVLLLVTDDSASGIARVASSSLVDGVVLMGVEQDDVRAALIRELAIPATFIGVPGDDHGLACVDLDFAAAARDSVRRLAALGHRTIGVVGHPQSYTDRDAGFVHRFSQAFDAECAALGIRTAEVNPHINRASVAVSVDELLAALPGMTGLVLHCNEPVAESVLSRLRDRGVRIPSDLSVIAACASYETETFETPLSSIPLPFVDMCRGAVEATLSQIGQGRTESVDLLPPEFVDRGSLAAVPS